MPEARERLRETLGELRARRAHDVAVGAGGVGQRAEDVEHGANAELRAQRAGELHRGVERLREHEADAGLLDDRRRPAPA